MTIRAGRLMPRVVMSLPVLLTGVLVSIVVLASGGCDGSGGSDAYGESDAVSLSDQAVTVEMKDNSFEPQGIRVKPGTTVTWVNNDPAVHNVRQVESAFLSPDINPAGMFIFSFDKPGRYRYQCTYHHPNMNGVVFVEEG